MANSTGWRFAGVIVAVLAGGCAAMEEDYSAARNSWQGASYEAVIAQWGQPARHTLLADGRNVYTWSSQQGGGSGTWFPSVGIAGGDATSSLGVGTGVALNQGAGDPLRCERTLYFKEGRVVDQSWLGPWRYCSTFRRN